MHLKAANLQTKYVVDYICLYLLGFTLNKLVLYEISSNKIQQKIDIEFADRVTRKS